MYTCIYMYVYIHMYWCTVYAFPGSGIQNKKGRDSSLQVLFALV